MFVRIKSSLRCIIHSKLRKEMIIILMIKCALLFALWKICFADPIADQLSNIDIVNHLIDRS